MSFLIFLVVVCSINLAAVLIYAISSFGNGMVFHIGWQLCARISAAELCSGSIGSAGVQITIAAIFLLPIQLYMLIDHVDWKLGINLSITQQVGVFIGMYLSFSIHSEWVARGLGLSMLVVAFQKTFAEIQSLEAGRIGMSVINKYELYGLKNYLLVWFVGITSGFFGGLYASGGPPLMWFVATINLEKNVCRGTVSFLYLVENAGRLIYLVIFAPRDDDVLNLSKERLIALCIALTATSITSLAAGNLLSSRIDQQCFRYLILALLGVGSTLLATTGSSRIQTIVLIFGSILIYSFLSIIYYLRKIQRQAGIECSSEDIGKISSSTITIELADNQKQEESQMLLNNSKS